METTTINREAWASGMLTSLCRYQLMVYPDLATNTSIKAEQQYLYRQYQVNCPGECPGIMIAQFMAREDMEDTLIRWMHRIISTQNIFRVNIQGYGALSSRQLYLRVQEQEPFQQLATALQVIDQYIRSYDCPPLKRYTHPYLPLTGMVAAGVFDSLVEEYAPRKVNLSFEVNEIILIRHTNESTTGKQVNLFRLQPA